MDVQEEILHRFQLCTCSMPFSGFAGFLYCFQICNCLGLHLDTCTCFGPFSDSQVFYTVLRFAIVLYGLQNRGCFTPFPSQCAAGHSACYDTQIQPPTQAFVQLLSHPQTLPTTQGHALQLTNKHTHTPTSVCQVLTTSHHGQ